MPDDYDAKKYICAPWHGERGAPWSRKFRPEFENALKLQKDNFSTMNQFLFGKDFGGWHPAAPAHIAGAGALAVQNALSTQARTTRGDTYVALLKTNILDEDIKDGFESYLLNTLPGMAPRPVAAVPPGPGGAAVAGQLPTDWALQLWLYIDTEYGSLAQNGLLRSNQGATWTNFKLTDVGIDKGTLRRFYAELQRKNRERQAPFADIDVWTKFMEQITFPRLLHDEATRQLQNPTILNAAGNPDLGAAVSSFEQLWHKIWDEGKELQFKAAPKPAGREVSNRVDGMQVEQSYAAQVAAQTVLPAMLSSPVVIDNPDALISRYVWAGITNEELMQAFITTTNTGEAFAFLQRTCNVDSVSMSCAALATTSAQLHDRMLMPSSLLPLTRPLSPYTNTMMALW